MLYGGLFEERRERTPQGGPSPLFSKRVLNELDRGHRFVPNADEGNIYVGSEKAGRRVTASLTRFIGGRLKLQVQHGEECCRLTVAPVVPRLHGQG